MDTDQGKAFVRELALAGIRVYPCRALMSAAKDGG